MVSFLQILNQYWSIIISRSSYFIYNFLSFYLVFFFLSQDLIQDITWHLFTCPLRLSWLWQFLKLALFLITLAVVRNIGKVFSSMYFSGDLSGLHFILFFFFLKTTGVKDDFHHILLSTCHQHVLHSWCWPWSPDQDNERPL